MGAGAGVQKITTDVTGNDTAGMVAGMVASGVTAKGLNGIEAEANKLAKAPKGIDGVTEGVGNLAEDVGKAGKGLEGAGKGAESAAEDAGKVVETSGSKTPSEIARSWQGTGKYPGIDDYVDVTVEKGTVLYRGEPNGTEYFTTLDAIEQSGRDATKLFEGLQVEKNPIHGYRGEMQGYIFNEDVASAYGITNANPQFGKGGLPQYYVPDVQDLIDKGILTPVDNIKLNK